MAFFRKRDKRLERKANRKRKKAARKEHRAEKAAGRGNTQRAERLEGKADKLRKKSSENLFWDHAVVEQKAYRATTDELQTLRTALEYARTRAELVEKHLAELEFRSKDDARALWNNGPIGVVFGNDPKPSSRRKFLRRMRKITNALLRENLYIRMVDKGKRWGGAHPSVFNRAFSKNVRIRVDLPFHIANLGGRTLDEEVSDTIVHEIAHTLNVITNEPGNDTMKKALRNPASFAAFFREF